ncbi:MAG: GNAT family N-acetyltransferase [Alphaproteobacteria bacterium]
MQAPFYGLASAQTGPSRPKWAVIEIDGEEAGFFQILESRALGRLLHAVILDRGPLWYAEYGSHQHFEAFLQAFRREFPARPGRTVRFIPEIEASPEIEVLLKKHKFRKKSEDYQTIVLDLTQSEDHLRAALKKKWRGSLQKAEKAGITVEWHEDTQHLDWLLKSYALDKKTKGYDGPSVQLIKALANCAAPDGDLLIGRARHEGRAIAAILLFCHGRSATYQIGWNTQEGRRYGAHNLLLWQAMLHLKAKNITAFDLGGVNESEAKTVKTFKEGMGGRLITLAGLYT